MAYYLVVNDGWNEKETILYPNIYGPFASLEEAEAARDAHPRSDGGLLHPITDGYAAIHIVGPETAGLFEGWGEEEDEDEEDDK